MSEVGELERNTQNRVIKLFVDRLGYKYLGDWHERPVNNAVEEQLLRDYLSGQGVSETLVSREFVN